MPKAQRITYWLVTVFLAAGLVASGVQQLIGVEGDVPLFTKVLEGPALMP